MQLTKTQFINRFTNPEFIGILTASKTDINVEGWLFRFNNAIDIETTDIETIAGIESLVARGLLTQARADEILGTVSSWNGWHLGQIVRVLPPFDTGYPGEYPIIAINPTTETITIEVNDSGADFAPVYLEAV